MRVGLELIPCTPCPTGIVFSPTKLAIINFSVFLAIFNVLNQLSLMQHTSNLLCSHLSVRPSVRRIFFYNTVIPGHIKFHLAVLQLTITSTLITILNTCHCINILNTHSIGPVLIPSFFSSINNRNRRQIHCFRRVTERIRLRIDSLSSTNTTATTTTSTVVNHTASAVSTITIESKSIAGVQQSPQPPQQPQPTSITPLPPCY